MIEKIIIILILILSLIGIGFSVVDNKFVPNSDNYEELIGVMIISNNSEIISDSFYFDRGFPTKNLNENYSYILETLNNKGNKINSLNFNLGYLISEINSNVFDNKTGKQIYIPNSTYNNLKTTTIFIKYSKKVNSFIVKDLKGNILIKEKIGDSSWTEVPNILENNLNENQKNSLNIYFYLIIIISLFLIMGLSLFLMKKLKN